MENTLLNIKNLTTQFKTEEGYFTAVNEISFELKKGETIGIVGESGSGKSVTSLNAMRLLPEDEKVKRTGEILFTKAGETIDLAKISEVEMRKIRGNDIAMIFQEPMTALNPVYTCGNQVSEALLLHQQDLTNISSGAKIATKLGYQFLNLFRKIGNIATVGKARFFNKKWLTPSEKKARIKTIELFKKVQLPRPEHLFDSYPHQLSGGQKQRVMIAMALSCNPSLLIADEPTTALDVTVQKSILKLMKDLQKEFKMGIIFITHDLGVIAELADKVLVMYKGAIVEQGSVQEIFTNAQHPYTKGLLACRPPLDIRLRQLPTRDLFMTEVGDKMQATSLSVDAVLETLKLDKTALQEKHEVLYNRPPLVSVKHLKTYFPKEKSLIGKPKEWVKAVDDVSFDVYKGETLGLVGESGCGKTTLGRTLLKLIEPTSGEVIYDGKEISGYTNRQMRKLRNEIQIIFQDPYSSLNPKVTVGEAIAEPLIVHQLYNNKKEVVAEVQSLLTKVGLKPEHYHRYPHEFSGGQRQRICIARSIALKPKLVICDESVSALDVSVQAEVLNLLNEIKEEYKLTYLFISHDLSVVKFMSDRIMVMNKGKIEEIGETETVYSSPSSEYTKKLIAAIPKGLTVESSIAN
ncbi:MAG: ABC transporter ATP-binding protein [Flavobacteriales bacterium]|jgi:peptide/nickel transport system ATP-binding protein|nr:ABC transporter ATP-binding protein [Flavobacteriales bacterium]